jgi:DNA integrity scanning protein DisA with diadenylate cyclase activity
MKKSVSIAQKPETSNTDGSVITDSQMIMLTSRAFDIKDRQFDSTKESGQGTPHLPKITT